MSEVIGDLISALYRLSKVEKEKVIIRLMDNLDFQQIITAYLVKKNNEIYVSNNEVKQAFPNQEKIIVSGNTEQTIIILDNKPASSTFIGRSQVTGPRKLLDRLRQSYLLELEQHGIMLNRAGTVWTRTKAGMWVALPLAQESDNRWFLGLRESEIYERNSDGAVTIILLCARSGVLLDFVLPPHKVQELLPLLSKSKDGIKFNLKKSGLRYMLELPRLTATDVTEYRHKISVLK